ncbi:cytochrome b5-like heme binding domain-containing protein [Penicillium argentinense]|uniref:Cytochrome b5-like heme binding domain-containing protein n=1 Tax=Penicillium argentinense TaxID=1131581 RepID=A0A9W9FMH3_9EURO|nr:cytochrome b5-like heme binding domain-containing protein [Penicillium argentinense]KAJ5102911.1 cytochrome b5-like heme binding domain-containing protein [Penicillium argentinense]
MSQTFSPADVASHNSADKGMYIIVDTGVYDVTKFVDEHPGGAKILKRVAGKDASKQFWKYHNESVLKKYSPKLKIGEVKDAAKL